jgi:homeobox protein cut-like
MEGGLDVEAHAAQEEEPKQAGGEAETDEGNKFQKAIGAWRSMTTQCLCLP